MENNNEINNENRGAKNTTSHMSDKVGRLFGTLKSILEKQPISGAEWEEFYSLEISTGKNYNVISYHPAKNVLSIRREYKYKDWEDTIGKPSTRNINLYQNEGKLVTQGTDYCSEEEEDYPWMGETQIDPITTYESFDLVNQLHEITTIFVDKRYNRELGDNLNNTKE